MIPPNCELVNLEKLKEKSILTSFLLANAYESLRPQAKAYSPWKIALTAPYRAPDLSLQCSQSVQAHPAEGNPLHSGLLC
jgi:hypothetical protein